MGILSDFIIHAADGIPVYDGVGDFPSKDRLQLKSLTVLEAAGLLQVLRGGGDSLDMISEFQFIEDDSEETCLAGTPDDFLAGLARLELGEIPSVAESFRQVTVEELNWTADECIEVISELAVLAKRAQTLGGRMYLWNSL